MRINLGEFGFRTAQPVEGARAPAQAFTKGDNLADAAFSAAATVLRVTTEQNELERRKKQAAELQDNIGRATLELGELEVRYENDTEFKTSRSRFQAEAQKLREKYVASIGDEVVRSAFGGEFQKIALSKELGVHKAAFSKERDYNQASLERSLGVFADEAAKATTPEDRGLMMRQASIAITAMQGTGWISAEEAVKKEQSFLARMDDTLVRRDITTNPSAAADRLALDPEYAKHLAPEVRQRWVDTAYRRSETERVRLEAAETKRRKERGDELMKEALSRSALGTLSAEYVEQIRPFVEPSEYKSLLKAMAGEDRKDDPSTFARLEGLVETNPQEARRAAFIAHRNGHITNQTLASLNTRSRTLERQEGPRSPYERERAHITQVLKPSEFITDPAPAARYALAIREFDDFATTPDGKPRTDKEMREKADEIVKRFSLVDMTEIARKTGLGAQPTPEAQLEEIRVKAEGLIADRDAGKISKQEFNRRMAPLQRARQAAEKARSNAQR